MLSNIIRLPSGKRQGIQKTGRQIFQRSCRRELYLIVLPVLIRIHWGMGRFCFIFLASFCLILNVFFDDCEQHNTTRAPLDQELVYRSDDYQNYTILGASPQPKENEKTTLSESTYHGGGRKRTCSTTNPNFGGRVPNAIAKREKRTTSRPSTYTGYVRSSRSQWVPYGEITSKRLATPDCVAPVAQFAFLRGVLRTPTTSSVLSCKCGNVSLDV